MKIRSYKPGDFIEVAELVRKTFHNTIIREVPARVGKRYEEQNDYRRNPGLKEKFRTTPVFLLAVEKKRVIGIVRGRKDHLSQLVVDVKHQRKNVGKALLEVFEQVAKKSGIRVIKINSALSAVGFYQKCGYVKTTGVRKNAYGFPHQPMKKRLKS